MCATLLPQMFEASLFKKLISEILNDVRRYSNTKVDWGL